MEYMIPTSTARNELEFNKSRFISTAGFVTTVDDAKGFIHEIRAEFPLASHHVYAYRIGYGNTVTEGVSDDGEPAGTSGPPILSVIRGTTIGDVIIVVTRFFGGRKLGTGGLVRAYTQSAQEVLKLLDLESKIEKVLLEIVTPYPLYDKIKHCIRSFDGHIENEVFAQDVAIVVTLTKETKDDFCVSIQNISSGAVMPVFKSTI